MGGCTAAGSAGSQFVERLRSDFGTAGCDQEARGLVDLPGPSQPGATGLLQVGARVSPMLRIQPAKIAVAEERWTAVSA